MKMLLTSAGIRNASIKNALLELLGKPISECVALCNSTASYTFSNGAQMAWNFITGNEPETPMCELGWKSVGLLEFSALPSMDRALWLPTLQEADVLLVNGGDPLFLCHWMRQSGMGEILPTLKLVYVGLSAGSMVLAPNIGEFFVGWTPPDGGDKTLGLVNFAMFPHLGHEMLPHNTMANAEKWAASMSVPSYAMDDETAIKVVDGKAEVISEGNWKLFNA